MVEALLLLLLLRPLSHGGVQCDFLAGVLGLQKVGWVFCQANKERDWIVSSSEVRAARHSQRSYLCTPCYIRHVTMTNWHVAAR
jgi:hypothetical protein